MEKIQKESKPQARRRVVISRIKRRILKHNKLIRTLILSFFILALYLLLSTGFSFLKKTNVGYYIQLFSDFVFTPSEKIEQVNRRTNLIILGKGGEGHEAPDLTDTIIFASISHQNQKIALISLPRDIWIPELRAKLNSIYYWGNKRQEGGGPLLAKSVVEEVVGQPVHYYLVIDFKGFEKIIDTLGGVEVNVERSFTDEKYPIPGKENDECSGDPEFRCRYETIHFEKGVQVMDGNTALKFARSRNAEGDEGTDFARAARQQEIIKSLKNKIFNLDFLLKPKKVRSVLEVISNSLETDIKGSISAILARRLLDSSNKISSHVLSEELLINPPLSPKYDNLYVFIAKDEDFRGIHAWVDNLLP